MVKAMIFDFGGVLAEEGFKEGLKAIGRKNGFAPDDFFMVAEELIYQSGYVTGMSDESHYWNSVRERTGISGSDAELREEILKRFILRSEMIQFVEKIKPLFVIAILSDQTNWLDEINQETPFYHHFNYIFNSFRLKKSKKDPTIFKDVCSEMGFKPEEILFVDDNIENVKQASSNGLQTIHFKGILNFKKEIEKYL